MNAQFLENVLSKIYYNNTDICNKAGYSSPEEIKEIAKAKDITIQTESPLKADNDGRIDILIETSNSLIVIENKIFSGIHDSQLTRYEQEFEKDKRNKIFIYLTPTGEKPIEDGIEKTNWCVFSYKDIVAILKDFKGKSKINQILKDYIEMINTDILKKNNKLLRKCKEIYKKNQDAFELIRLYLETSQEKVINYCYEWIGKNIANVKLDSKKSAKGSVVFRTSEIQAKFKGPKECFCEIKTYDNGKTINGCVVLESNESHKWNDMQEKCMEWYGKQVEDEQKRLFLINRVKISPEDHRCAIFDEIKQELEDNLRKFYDKVKELDEKLKTI